MSDDEQGHEGRPDADTATTGAGDATGDATGDDSIDTAGDRNAGRLTTMIPRPADRRASDAGGSRLSTFAGHGRTDDRIARHGSGWLFAAAGVIVAASIAGALFVLPVRTWFDQDDRIQELESELDEVEAVNSDLKAEVDRLQTPEGIKEASRDELGLIVSGEDRKTAGQFPPLPRDMPLGWPYSQVDQILVLRSSEAAAAPATVARSAVDSVAPAPATTTPATANPATTEPAADAGA